MQTPDVFSLPLEAAIRSDTAPASLRPKREPLPRAPDTTGHIGHRRGAYTRRDVAARVLASAVDHASFTDASRGVFEHLKLVESSFQRRALHLNPVGGVSEIENPQSTYRKSLEARSNLLLLWLLLAFSFMLVNSCELLGPNVLVVVRAVFEDEVPTMVSQVLLLIMAVYELLGFTFLVCMVVNSGCRALGHSGFDKWNHLTMLAWDWIPLLARFSAIKFLGRVHPKTVFDELQGAAEKHHVEGRGRMRQGKVVRAATLLLLRKALVLVCGMAALMVKVQQISLIFSSPAGSVWLRLWQAAELVAFVNQCINIVDVNILVKKEALRFAFSGEDAAFQREELIFVAVFRASVAQGLWNTIGREQGYVRAFAALFGFNHKDVQRLALADGRTTFHVKPCGLAAAGTWAAPA